MDRLKEYYNGKKILITGHTGFKGSWLSLILCMLGADAYGYALAPQGTESLCSIINGTELIHNEIGDVRDQEHLYRYFFEVKPTLVIHMAAQPLVRESYKNPHYTYETNVMGTVNVCECIRKTDSVKSFLNVTTDKVYFNHEWPWGYREIDRLDGCDPYSNSKSCSELITNSYRSSFFRENGVAASTARAGNVIGGGDYAEDRIIPDCVRSAIKKKEIVVRNPVAIRPFQHVLEPLIAYLEILYRQEINKDLATSYNIGPEDMDCVTVKRLVELFCETWGNNIGWTTSMGDGPHESTFLKLDCSRMKQTFGWKPKWNIEETIQRTVEWYRTYERIRGSENVADYMRELMKKQIEIYCEG